MVDKWNLIIDVAKCENCHNCSLATKDEHIGNDFPGYSAPQPRHGHDWIRITRKVRGSGHLADVAYLPTMCNHCDDAPCVKAGKGAVTKRDDGIVIIDPVKAKGRRDLVAACPHEAISWNEELDLPQAWTFDAHLLDNGWKEPRASQACPTGAMRAVKCSDEEMEARAARDGLEVLDGEAGTRPRVRYRNLYRFNRAFVGGSVVAEIDGRVECVEGAEVRLLRGSAVVQQATTDAFGDFKFDALLPDGTTYAIRIAHPKYGAARVEAPVADSVELGTIMLGQPPA